MSETTGNEKIGEPDERDLEREDPNPRQVGRLEEREQRQQAVQQHGDTFAVDSDEPTDTSGVEQGSAANRVTALPGNEPDGDEDN